MDSWVGMPDIWAHIIRCGFFPFKQVIIYYEIDSVLNL